MHPLSIRIIRPHSLVYRDVWELQRSLQKERIEDRIPDTLLLCEHEPVLTIGKSGKRSHILVDPQALALRGVTVIEIERGGDVTYHGPGQVVGYPILDLKNYRRDVGWYMRSLEDVVLRFLEECGVAATRREGRTGVWTASHQGDSVPSRKIASIGVRISRWCTMHGFSVNVRSCRDGFSLIHPCGFSDIEITSVEEELAVPVLPLQWSDPQGGRLFSFDEAATMVVNSFVDVFGCKPIVSEEFACNAHLRESSSAPVLRQNQPQ